MACINTLDFGRFDKLFELFFALDRRNPVLIAHDERCIYFVPCGMCEGKCPVGTCVMCDLLSPVLPSFFGQVIVEKLFRFQKNVLSVLVK